MASIEIKIEYWISYRPNGKIYIIIECIGSNVIEIREYTG